MSYKLEGNGIFVFCDPAGANSVLALIDNLMDKGKQEGIDFLVFTNLLGVFPKSYEGVVRRIEFCNQSVAEIIDDFQPNFIFSATSLESYEHDWRKVALQKNVKTIAFIDHWTSYLKRFSFNDEIVFANEIWVINEIAKIEAMEAGIPEKLLVNSGNPYYEKVKAFRPTQSKESFFSSLSIDSTKKTILFISDDIKKSVAVDKAGNSILGFDEFTVFKDILISLGELEDRINFSNYQLLIKLHPRAKENKFDELISKYAPSHLSIHCIQRCDPLTINYYSDYMLGMFSNMVIESMLMNKKGLRIQTGMIIKDLMKYNEHPFQLITNKDNLTSSLGSFLLEN
jgi:hypothetical protein